MLKFEYLEEVIELFEAYQDNFGDQLVIPCTPKEVNKLEALLPEPYRLPTAYKEFLLYCGKDMGYISGITCFSYKQVLSIIQDDNRDIKGMLEMCDADDELPADIFVISQHIMSNFEYILLSEGDNPPVYFWSEEEEAGLETAFKRNDSFAEYLMDMIATGAMYAMIEVTTEKLNKNQVPRGKQFWIPTSWQQVNGVAIQKIKEYLGFLNQEDMRKAVHISGLDTHSYLEELSGWKAHQVGDEIRFFPPSYESPEEREKKALELQNQIESKKQELASVEKTITNIQNRIKNLSGGKLTGGINFFDNPSASRIKELEKELIKQKVRQQNLEFKIAELEKK